MPNDWRMFHAEALIAWIVLLRAKFSGRLVDVTADIADYAERLRAAAATRGSVTEPLDSLIAATAISKGAVVVTRNVRDFAALGVTTLNPWLPP